MPIGSLAPRTSPNTGQPISPSNSGRAYRIFFSFKLTGAYVGGGDPFDFGIAFVNAVLGPGFTAPGSLPEKVEFQSVATPGRNGLFVYQFVPGTTLANGTIQVFTGAAAQAALTELNAGAYPASVLSDVIEGEAIFPRQ